MGTGKIASQASHAAIGAFLKASKEIQEEYHSDGGIGTKVCLECSDGHTMQRLHEEARAMGLPCFYVIDSGCPNFFDGAPTATALGIGPIIRAQSRFLRKLKLMN